MVSQLRMRRSVWRLRTRLLVVFVVFLLVILFYVSIKPTPEEKTVLYDLPDLEDQEESYNIGQVNVVMIVQSKKEKIEHKIELMNDQHKVGCNFVTNEHPYNTELTKYIHELNPRECEHDEIDFEIKDGKILVKGKNIVKIITREIHLNYSNLFSYKEPVSMFHFKGGQTITKGTHGSIQSIASGRCIFPDLPRVEEKVNDSAATTAPENVFPLMYISACKNKDAMFVFKRDGTFVHSGTRKCIAPKDEVVTNDTELVISDDCSSKFRVLHNKVLQHISSGLCVHPLGGGAEPDEQQLVCLYDDCTDSRRISFSWRTDNEYQLTGVLRDEFTLVQVYMEESERRTLYMQLVPRSLPGSLYTKTSPNIFVIIIDEISRNHFKRKLPYSYKYMSVKMNMTEYRKFASITHNLRDNVIALVSGKKDHNTSSKGDSLFSIARRKNYATLFSSDETHLFDDDIDVHHNTLPFFHSLRHNFEILATGYCLAKEKIYDVTFNYFKSFIHSYFDVPKMGVIALSQITKTNFNRIGEIDNSLLNLLVELRNLQNTIVIVQSVKGSTLGKLGKLKAGLLEEKQPILSTFFSHDIQSKYKLSPNSDVITTPYDLHATLHEILTQKTSFHKYGRSLLNPITNRNCYEAGISRQSCPCS